MKKVCENFMRQRLPAEAVAAWGLRFGDRTGMAECFADWFAPEQVEQTLNHLMNATNTLRNHQLEPVRLCWVFEHVRIFLALRPDDTCAGIFAENRPGFSFSQIEQIMDEFLALPESQTVSLKQT